MKKRKKLLKKSREITKNAVIKVRKRDRKNNKFHIGIYINDKLSMSFLLPESALNSFCTVYTPLKGDLVNLMKNPLDK
jgi:hypothetical protein